MKILRHFIICLMIFPLFALADEDDSGKIFKSFAVDFWNKSSSDMKGDRPYEQRETNAVEIRPKAEFGNDKLNLNLSSRLRGFTDFSGAGADSDDDLEMRLYNAYVSYIGNGASIKAGNQVVTWGKTDEISPLDNINPEDYRDGPLVRRRIERKIPIPMLNTEAFNDMGRVQGIFIPRFKRSRIFLYDSDWAVAGNNVENAKVNEGYPSDSLSDSEYGLKLASTVKEVDFSLTFLSTRSDLPSLRSVDLPEGFGSLPQNVSIEELTAFSNATDIFLETEYNRKDIYGFDFETTVGEAGLRGDLAYIKNEDFLNTSLQTERKAAFKYVLGADYLSPSDFYINLQYTQTRIEGYREDLLHDSRYQNGFYGEISREFFRKKLKVGTRVLTEEPLRQDFYNPYVKLKYWDSFNFEVGANVINGQKTAPLGLYRQNDEVYIVITAFY